MEMEEITNYQLRSKSLDRNQALSNSHPLSNNTFKKPSKSNVIKRRRMETDIEIPVIPTHNSFASLSESDAEEDPLLTLRRRTHLTHPKVVSTSVQANSDNIITQKQKPIIVANASNELIQRMVKDAKFPVTYSKKRDGKTFHIHTTSKVDKTFIMSALNEKNIQFHTFTEPEDRRSIYVLKNHYNLPADQLLSKLKDSQVPAIHVDYLLDNKENPIYKVHFEKKSLNCSTLNFQHKEIDKLRVNWEHLRNDNKRLTRCSNCQRWGHAATNCAHTFRCIKCLENHPKGECKRTNPTVGSPSCVNCGKSGHPSNSVICEEYIKYKDYIDQRRRKTQIRPQQQPKKFTSTPAPWANNQTNTYTSNNLVSEYEPKADSWPSLDSSTRVQTVKKTSNSMPSTSRNHNRFENSSYSSNLQDLQAEFASIPNLDEILNITRKVIYEMKSANSPNDAAKVLVKFLMST